MLSPSQSKAAGALQTPNSLLGSVPPPTPEPLKDADPAWATSGRLSSKTATLVGTFPNPLDPCLPTHTVRALETTFSLKQGETAHINKGDPVDLALKPLLLEAAFCLSDTAAKWSLP